MGDIVMLATILPSYPDLKCEGNTVTIEKDVVLDSNVRYCVDEATEIISPNKSTLSLGSLVCIASLKMKGLRLRGTLLVGGPEEGAKVESVVIEDCEFIDDFSEAESDGIIRLNDVENAVIKNTEVTGKRIIPGIFMSNTKGELSDCFLHDMGETLLVLNEGSDCRVSHCKLHKTETNGIYSNKSSLTLEHSEVSYTEYPGVYSLEGSANVYHNNIHHITQNAVSMNTTKGFEIKHNVIANVNGSAIAVMDKSEGLVSDNTVTDVEGNGLYIAGDCVVTITDNATSETHFPGIAVLRGSSATIERVKISNTKYNGICARGASHMIMKNCEIKNVNECGVSISDTPKTTITDVVIDNCGVGGLEAYNKSEVTVSRCKISNARGCVFMTYAGGNIIATDNVIRKADGPVANVVYGGSITMTDNELIDVTCQVKSSTRGHIFCLNNHPFSGETNSEKDLKPGMTLLPMGSPSTKKCLDCGVNPRDSFIGECGHNILCMTCAKKRKEANRSCPLCRFPINIITPGFDAGGDDVCVICSENNPSGCIILPCGHMGVCNECLEHWYSSNDTCPMCRTSPSHFKRVIDIE